MPLTTFGQTSSTELFAPARSGNRIWDPGFVKDGGSTSTSLTVEGTAIGDPVLCGFTSIRIAGWRVIGNVIEPNVVSVTLTNFTDQSGDLGPGTLTAIVFQR